MKDKAGSKCKVRQDMDLTFNNITSKIHLHEELLSQNIYSTFQTGQENFYVTRQDKGEKKREIWRALEPVGGGAVKKESSYTHWEVLSEVRRSSGTERSFGASEYSAKPVCGGKAD